MSPPKFDEETTNNVYVYCKLVAVAVSFIQFSVILSIQGFSLVSL